ncbi:BCL2 associated agonist of cell death b isoform X1 [Brienomyrus brachyistius]|uniref:BCL2 associated agonist of cell death b isoform X1 n=1 Tax=Brienomyrus brachyistius TaxID=42636 RepID=UPI0020B2945D|nr:BCL2 associated agonist of cell death b isoform X1 [Brienomyrus brachyistius]
MSGVTMEHMFTISGNESDTSESDTPDVTENSQLGNNLRKTKNPGKAGGRVRMLSESQVSSIRSEDLDFGEGGASEEGGGMCAGDGTPFRGRSQSAPPALWAAQRYGRQLRRMSDEFDTLLDKGQMKRVRSAGAARQMQASPSWFAFLWSHKESDAEISGNLSTADSRAAQ